MANINIPRTEFAAALAQVATERGIDPEAVLESIKLAILSAYKKDYGLKDGYEYEVEIDPATGESKLYSWPEGKKDQKEEITPAGFGRIAAQQARNVIIQKIREAEKNTILEEYEKKVGLLTNGMILRFEGENILVDLGKTEALMPPSEQNRAENYRLGARMTFYIEGIRETNKGRQIIVSRTHPGLIEGLFKREVPEVNSGAVEIKAIAREPGSRTKVAVASKQVGVDPVGSCVGQKGVRVQAIIDELFGEKIDIVQYSEDPEKFILAALSPAENLEIKIDKKEKTAIVTAKEDQLSLAIGKGGQNARLASKLTGYKIEIVEEPKKGEKEKSEKETEKEEVKKEEIKDKSAPEETKAGSETDKEN